MMVAPARSSSSGCRPRTAPWVPTGMKHGVFTMPCGRVRVPARAAPSLASSSNWYTRLVPLVWLNAGSQDAHCVAVAVETVTPGDRVAIGGHRESVTGECGHQHQQRAARQVEIGQQVVDHPEAIAWCDH